MIIPVAALIVSIVAWMGNKALPAVWKSKQEKERQRIELIKDLCQNHNDCEPQRLYVMQKLKGRLNETHSKYDSKERIEGDSPVPELRN